MDREISNMKSRAVWDLVQKPEGVKTVGCRWVYTLKKDNQGNIVNYKSRLVAQGFSQRKGENYDETFSPVINFTLIRMVFAIFINLFHWKHYQIDINCAYLYANLSDIVYMRQPPGYVDARHPDYVCKLNRAIYGLKQSGREWYMEISSVLEKLNFNKLKWANGVFYKNGIILLLYVDDIVLIAETNEKIKKAIKTLESKFELKKLGPTKLLLGVKFNENNGKICLSQEHYIEEVYQRFKKFHPPISSLPISKGCIYSKSQSPTTNEELKEMEKIPYRSLIGCLAFIASRTRPDITFAVNLFSQFQQNPGQQHWTGLLKLLGYLYATKELSLDLSRTEKLNLTAYSDSDFAACRDDRISVGGYIIMCDRSPIVWRSAKQRCVALSTMESEFINIVETAKELMWIRNVLEECRTARISNINCEKYLLFNDNMSAISFSKSPIENIRSKHIDVRLHFVRDLVNRDIFEIKYINTKLNLADLFTKAPTKVQLQKFNQAVFF